MSPEQYRVAIREDEYSKVKGSLEKSVFKVMILRGTHTVVGVPLRGVTYDVAVRAQGAIQNAFGYGMEEQRKRMERTLWNQRTSLESEAFDEDVYLLDAREKGRNV